jgi:hypothetical protein
MSLGRRTLATATVWAVGATSLLACPICFQIEEGPVSTGVRLAVLVLIGVTGSVLAGFGTFIARFVARARALDAAGAREAAGTRTGGGAVSS